MSLSLVAAAALTKECAPQVAVPTMMALVMSESGFDPFAIGDNSTGRSHHPRDAASAEALAATLLAAGHSIDMGLTQINSRTAPRLGLSLRDAFIPCRNIAAAGRLMATNYRRVAPTSPTIQHAIARTLSTYNTGNAWRGFGNGYVGRVYRAAAIVAPMLGRTPWSDADPGSVDLAIARVTPPSEAASMSAAALPVRAVSEAVERSSLAPTWVAFGNPVNVMVFGGDPRGPKPFDRKEKP